MIRRMPMFLSVLTVLLSGTVSADEVPVASPAKVQVCVACHGENGIATINSYPNLAGQNRDYLIAALQAYKNRERNGGMAGIMQQQAALLTEQDIAEIAEYYSKLD